MAAICTTVVLAMAPPTTASAAAPNADVKASRTLVYILNTGAQNALLCANADDADVWIGSDKSDRYCQWEQIGDDGQVTFYNPAKGMVLTAPDSVGPLQMKDPAYSFTAAQTFIWVQQSGGARALRWYGNRQQYVDGGSGRPGVPTENSVRAANWRPNDPTLLWQLANVGAAAARPTRPVGAVHVKNGDNQMLCASPSDGSVRLGADRTDPGCEWLPFARSTGEFVLYNPRYGQVMTAPSGAGKPLALKDRAYPNTTGQLWRWGGDSTLQSYGDTEQDVDAGTSGLVRTRGSRTGNQPQSTWNLVAADPPTALVTLGDSFMSGEAGRWMGNSNTTSGSRDGTDRAYTGKGIDPYDPHIVYGDSYDNGCNRSDSAEAHSSGLMDEQINLACSGASTINVIRADQGGLPFKGEEPQADHLLWLAETYQVKLIALSIGGNDLGFSDIIKACIEDYTLSYPECNGTQQAQVDKKMADTKQGIRRAIDSINMTMKQAGYMPGDYRIILQSAPSPIPSGWEIELRYPQKEWGRLDTGGCPFFNVDATWARGELVSEISDAFSAVAKDAGVDFLDLRDTLENREVCSIHDSLVTSTTPPSPVGSEWARFLAGVLQGQTQESFHPNYYGQLAFGQCLALMAAQPTYRYAKCLNTSGKGPEGMVLKTSAQ